MSIDRVTHWLCSHVSVVGSILTEPLPLLPPPLPVYVPVTPKILTPDLMFPATRSASPATETLVRYFPLLGLTVCADADGVTDFVSVEIAFTVTRESPSYLLSASAGFGNPLDTTYEKEYMFLHATPAAKECDEIITACGDSMEPYIHNGDDLLVEHTNELEPGEVGIFVADGEGLVKQYQKDGLYSFNRKYPPRRFYDDDNVRCIGRVLGVVSDDMRATEEESAMLEKLYSEKRR